MDFRKVIYENVEKKTFTSTYQTNISVCTGHGHSEVS